MNPLRSVGARLSLALAAVVAGALALVYVIVVPSLEQRLIDSKLSQLRAVLPQIVQTVPQSPFDDWQAFLETTSETADARIVVYPFARPANGTGHAILGGPVEDSHNLNSRDIVNDPIAQRAADIFGTASGIVSRNGAKFAEVAVPVSPLGHVVDRRGDLRRAGPGCERGRARAARAGVRPHAPAAVAARARAAGVHRQCVARAPDAALLAASFWRRCASRSTALRASPRTCST